jgi:glycosyltransferase involved in cell wall biosynthesis
MTSDSSLGVIALVPDDWDYIVMPRHQVLRRLASHFPTVWVEPARNWRDHLPLRGDGSLAPDRWSTPVGGLEVLRTGWRHPAFGRPSWLAAASFRSRLSVARQRLLDRGAKRIALYIWRDEFRAALDLIDHDFSCYHVDDEYTFSEVDMPNSARETQLLRQVDQVIVHSRALFEKKGRINPRTALIHNGVDFKHFSEPHAEPPDMLRIPHPRVGYAGVIKKQLDLARMIRLARGLPQHSFVLVGPILNVSGREAEVAELRQLPNVFLLGAKPAEALPQYIQHFDVCLMCYEVNDYTKYIYPLKINEYLASGRPVISSPIDAVKEYRDIVAIASSDTEYFDAIEKSLCDPARAAGAVAARQRVARANDWNILVARIADLFRAGSTDLRSAKIFSEA